MVSGIKSCREVKETETGDLLATNGIDKMIMERKKYSFSRMKFAVSRWEEFKSRFCVRWSIRRNLTTRSVTYS